MGKRVELDVFIGLMRAYNQFKNLIEQDLEPYHLQVTEFSVLELLYSKGRQNVHSICQKVLIANSSITYVIKRLEKRGLVTREKCEKDRRIHYIELTAGGRQLMNEIFPEHLTLIRSIFDQLTDEELQQFKRFLKLLTQMND